MRTALRIGRNALFNWLALAFSICVAFFLSPFVIHQLGNAAYGVWILVVSLISYMGLLDLGLRGAITRFVSRDHARQDHAASSRAVSAALWLRLWISLVILTLSLTLSFVAPKVFNIPVELQPAAQWAILLTGASFALTLTCGVFGAVLAALQRYELLSTITILQALIRAAGIVLLLRSHHGIKALALWEFTVVLGAQAGTVFLCFRHYPQLRVFLQRPEPEILRTFFHYSFYVFLINVAIQGVYYSDNLVIGAFLSSQAITFYAIGGSLIEYLRQSVASLTATFTPLASSLDARGETDQLRRLLFGGTRAALLIALPTEAALFFRGPTFIRLWVGPEYAQLSGDVLRILLVAQLFAIANTTSGGIAYGLGKHKPVALWAVAEAAANLGISILLVRRIGIVGVALGTVIPSVVIHLFLWPRYVCKLLNISLKRYLGETWVRSWAAVIPFALGCYFTERLWSPGSLIQFFLQIAVVLPLYALGIVSAYWSQVRPLLSGWERFPSNLLDTGSSLLSGERK